MEAFGCPKGKKYEIMCEVEEEEDVELGCPSSSSSDGDESSNSAGSSSSDFMEDANSPSSSSTSPSSSSDQLVKNPLYEMSDLMAELPIKRGLSKHFQGKSQSFTSLSNVRCLGDLAKPQVQRPYKKRMMKTCKSYGGGLDSHKQLSRKGSCCKTISKKPSKSSLLPSLMAKRHSFRPPIHPHSCSGSNLSSQTLLFA